MRRTLNYVQSSINTSRVFEDLGSPAGAEEALSELVASQYCWSLAIAIFQRRSSRIGVVNVLHARNLRYASICSRAVND